MQKLASMSVIVKAEGGVSAAWYNRQRDRVVESIRAEEQARTMAAKAEADRQRDRANARELECKRLRKDNLELFSRTLQHRSAGRMIAEDAWACVWMTGFMVKATAMGAWRWLTELIKIVWAMIYVYTVCGGWLGVCETLGLVEYIGNDRISDNKIRRRI